MPCPMRTTQARKGQCPQDEDKTIKLKQSDQGMEMRG